MCINSGLHKQDTIGSLRALYMICRLKYQIHFRVVSGHIISVLANPLSNEYQFGPCRFQQTVNVSSQFLQSPNVDPSSSMDLSNDLILHERWRVIGGIEISTLTIPPQQTPSNDLLDAVD